MYIMISLQPVDVMLLDQPFLNVLIQLVNVPAMLDIREPNVMLLVVVIPLVQAALNAVSQQVNVLAKQDTQEQHVILVIQTTIEQVMELAKVGYLYDNF